MQGASHMWLWEIVACVLWASDISDNAKHRIPAPTTTRAALTNQAASLARSLARSLAALRCQKHTQASVSEGSHLWLAQSSLHDRQELRCMKYPRAAAPGGGVRKAGPDDRPSEKRNDLDNLLTLCTTIHRRKIGNARHHAQLHVLCNYPC